jgi:hypothetical protein
MGLLPEMLRILSDESNLINVATSYNVVSAAYATIHDYGDVTLSKAGLLLIKFTAGPSSGTGYFRIRVGATLYAYACKLATTTTCSFIVYLDAGTYGILAEAAGAGGITNYIHDFQAGFANFSDLTGEVLAAYVGAIAKTTTVRVTPVGDIKNTVYCVTVHAVTAGAQTNLENPGDALTNGVQILIDGVQQSWSERYQGDVNGMAAGGKLYVAASAGVSHSITVTEDNAATDETVSVAVCPWILPPVAFEPVEFSFSGGSTVYVVTEPLNVDVSKSVKIGKGRAVSFGDATDYYYASSGTGILISSYTFEAVKVGGNIMAVSGFGGCISVVAVDLR